MHRFFSQVFFVAAQFVPDPTFMLSPRAAEAVGKPWLARDSYTSSSPSPTQVQQRFAVQPLAVQPPSPSSMHMQPSAHQRQTPNVQQRYATQEAPNAQQRYAAQARPRPPDRDRVARNRRLSEELSEAGTGGVHSSPSGIRPNFSTRRFDVGGDEIFAGSRRGAGGYMATPSNPLISEQQLAIRTMGVNKALDLQPAPPPGFFGGRHGKATLQPDTTWRVGDTLPLALDGSSPKPRARKASLEELAIKAPRDPEFSGYTREPGASGYGAAMLFGAGESHPQHHHHGSGGSSALDLEVASRAAHTMPAAHAMHRAQLPYSSQRIQRSVHTTQAAAPCACCHRSRDGESRRGPSTRTPLRSAGACPRPSRAAPPTAGTSSPTSPSRSSTAMATAPEPSTLIHSLHAEMHADGLRARRRPRQPLQTRLTHCSAPSAHSSVLSAHHSRSGTVRASAGNHDYRDPAMLEAGRKEMMHRQYGEDVPPPQSQPHSLTDCIPCTVRSVRH